MLIGGFCTDTANIWHLVGLIVYIIKIVIPLILIVMGMIDLGKAVINSDEKAINKAVGTLVKRFIAAIVVFFIPTIVNAVFGIIGIVSGNAKADYQTCVDCVTETCKDQAEAVNAAFNPSTDPYDGQNANTNTTTDGN